MSVSHMQSCNFRELPFTIAHASALRSLPPIHQDPFERMLVAQAQVESMTLVTRDRLLPKYPISALAA
jgi:PIN domain nuclease of toxin-antitoxin system